MIKARADADMTQEQVAKAMGTTQAVVARLESGKVLPSTRTLERFAKPPEPPPHLLRPRNPEPPSRPLNSVSRVPHLGALWAPRLCFAARVGDRDPQSRALSCSLFPDPCPI